MKSTLTQNTALKSRILMTSKVEVQVRHARRIANNTLITLSLFSTLQVPYANPIPSLSNGSRKIVKAHRTPNDKAGSGIFQLTLTPNRTAPEGRQKCGMKLLS